MTQPSSRKVRARIAVAVLGFGTFAVGTDEFVLAGVLPQLGDSLGVSVATAGQVVTVFALTCALLAPVLAMLTAGWSRRRVLLLAVLVYLAGNVATALAPSFAFVLIAQLVAAAGAGLYVPTASVTAAALVPEDRRGRAIAVVTTGFTAATALGAPIGTLLGGLLGWRATMWFVAGLAVLGLLGVLALVPAVSAPAPEGLRPRLAPLGDRRVLAVLATTLAGFTAVYLPYVYISAVFEPATGGGGDRLAVLIFTLGVIGTAGNFAAGSLADRIGARRVVAVALGWLAAVLVVLPLTTGGFGTSVAIIVAYGVAAFAITTPQQHRLITLRPESASVLVSLNAAVLYLAISLAGMLGGAGIGLVGANRLSLVAAGLAILALALSEVAGRLTLRSTMDRSVTGEPVSR
ncbi:MFS transporter [Amycolatopsis anabasis]|uniref:MFS transporter n=1 Tax=Amycolatopsis anabasis TaxID=1840409 RepID=UPI00131D467A|nr:MFS transporter [Amycolatopsis anabasis]